MREKLHFLPPPPIANGKSGAGAARSRALAAAARRAYTYRMRAPFLVQERQPLLGDLEPLGQAPLQTFHRLFQGHGELIAGPGGRVDVHIHGRLALDGVAGWRPPAATPGGGLVVHSLTWGSAGREAGGLQTAATTRRQTKERNRHPPPSPPVAQRQNNSSTHEWGGLTFIAPLS